MEEKGKEKLQWKKKEMIASKHGQQWALARKPRAHGKAATTRWRASRELSVGLIARGGGYTHERRKRS